MFLKLSKWFSYLSLLSVVIVMASIFFPFIGGKYAFFRIFTELSLACFLLWWAFQARPKDLKGVRALLTQPLPLAVTAFVTIFLLAALFAPDPAAAFWSNYERGDGAFQILHYYVLFLMALLTFRSEKDWRGAFWVSTISAGLMILYGLASAIPIGGFISAYGNYEHLGFFKKLFAIRFQGSLGNPEYVAPYLMFSVTYVAYLWLSLRRRLSKWTHAGYLAVIASFVLFFILSNTRGAFIGAFAGLVAFVLYVGFSKPALRKTLLWVVLGLLVVGSVLFSFRKSAFVQHLPGNRIFAISLSERTVQTRFWTWGSAWEGFKERPLLGWGPENFTTVFDKHFDPRHYLIGAGSETWFDRAHSVIFDYLAETGILGLLGYLSMFVMMYYHFFKSLRAKKEELSVWAKAFLVAMPIAYIVQGLALFDVLPMYINLFLFAAFITFKFPTSQVAFHETESSPRR
jgi:O-antigen ligase